MNTDFDWHWPNAVPRGKRYAYDIETNGLIPEVSMIHCLVLCDLDTEEYISCADQQGYVPIADGLGLLMKAEIAIGHNIIGYDNKALKKLFGKAYAPQGVSKDTLVLSKMLWQTEKLRQLDFPKWRRSKQLEEEGKEPTFPGQLIGAHKLEAWGYRLGQMKGDYSHTVKEWSKVYMDTETLEGIPKDFWVLATKDDKGRCVLDPWLAWNKPMQDYCEQDVRVTVAFLKLIMEHLTGTASAAKGIGWSPRSVSLEHRMWEFCEELKERGFGYDIKEGVKLAATLKNRKGDLERTIQEGFGSWWEPLSDKDKGEYPKAPRAVVHLVDGEPLPDVTIPRTGKGGKPLAPYVGPPKATYSPDAPFTKVERKQLNPGSLKQLGDRLQAVYQWQPTDWVGLKDENGKGTQAKLDESVLKEMEESILPIDLRDLLLEYMVVKKTLGQLSDGKKAWNSLVNQEDLRLHGRIDPLGTVTMRGAHSDPNLGQVPAVSFEELKDDQGVVYEKKTIWGFKGGFGAECRRLFTPGIRTALGKPGFKCQTGIDASGLQLRCLGHYLQPYDGGEFAKRVSTPGVDIHAENARIADLTRKDAKTWIYAWLFGAGNHKLGAQLGVPLELIDHYANSASAKSYKRFIERVNPEAPPLDRMGMAFVGKGSEVSKKFIEAIVGLKDLKETIKHEAEEFGFIVAVDGRKIHIRKPHAALNSLLMSCEAVITKNWLLETQRLLTDEYNLEVDKDFGCMGWVHDEAQYEHREGLGGILIEAGSKAMTNVEGMLDFLCPLATEGKTGANWLDCH